MKRLAYILLSLWLIFPFLFLLLLSLAESWRFPTLFPALSLQHWQQLFSTQSDLLQSFFLSLFISLSVATWSTLSGFVTSRYISRSRFRRSLLMMSYFPYVLSPVIYAACLYIYFMFFGLAGNVLGVIIGQIMLSYPFAIIFFASFWTDRILSIEQLAQTLGGNPWQNYRRIILPIAKGMLLVCFFQTFLISWFEYGLTAFIGVRKVATLTIRVYQYVNEANVFLAALSSSLLILPPAVLLWLNKRIVFK